MTAQNYDIASTQANAAKEAAQNILDLSGFGTLGGMSRVVCKVITRHDTSARKFYCVRLAICGHSRSAPLGQSREDKAIRAAIAAAAAEIDAPFYLEVA